MSEVRMSVGEARKKLSLMLTELETIPANSPNQADREYRMYLTTNISTYENAIQAFDEVSSEL